MARALRLVAACLLAVVLTAGPLSASVVLTLKDGQRVEAVDAKLLGDTYMVTLKSGDVLSLPVSLVTGIEVNIEPPEPPPPPVGEAAPPSRRKGPDEPRTLSGPEVRPLTTSEQLRAFDAPPAEFAKPTFDPYWQPTNGFTELNRAEMKPTEWAKPSIDPVWKPQNGFTELNDPQMKPTEWAKPSIDPHWQPTDAWAR